MHSLWIGSSAEGKSASGRRESTRGTSVSSLVLSGTARSFRFTERLVSKLTSLDGVDLDLLSALKGLGRATERLPPPCGSSGRKQVPCVASVGSHVQEQRRALNRCWRVRPYPRRKKTQEQRRAPKKRTQKDKLEGAPLPFRVHPHKSKPAPSVTMRRCASPMRHCASWK